MEEKFVGGGLNSQIPVWKTNRVNILAPFKQELTFTFCDMSGVITVANCNHFVGWRVLECLFALSVKNKQKKGVGSASGSSYSAIDLRGL